MARSKKDKNSWIRMTKKAGGTLYIALTYAFKKIDVTKDKQVVRFHTFTIKELRDAIKNQPEERVIIVVENPNNPTPLKNKEE